MELGFYSSYSYNLTDTLNKNMIKNALYLLDSHDLHKEGTKYYYSD